VAGSAISGFNRTAVALDCTGWTWGYEVYGMIDVLGCLGKLGDGPGTVEKAPESVANDALVRLGRGALSSSVFAHRNGLVMVERSNGAGRTDKRMVPVDHTDDALHGETGGSSTAAPSEFLLLHVHLRYWQLN